MTRTTRVRPGSPAGGRFATTAHPEAEITLSATATPSTPSTRDTAALVVDILDLSDLDRCPVCTGSGSIASGTPCPACEGTGSLDTDDAWTRARATQDACTRPCTECDEGVRPDLSICPTCDGEGSVLDYSLAG